MATPVTCPTLAHMLESNNCMENFAGLGSSIYIGLISELSAKMALTDATFAAPAFAAGKGLYKVDIKEETAKIEGSSLGKNKGFKQTLNFTIDKVNKDTSKLFRAINNNNIFVVVPDGEEFQIMYHPTYKITKDADALKTDTGDTRDSDRQSTISLTLSGATYPNTWVNITDIEPLIEGYVAPTGG